MNNPLNLANNKSLINHFITGEVSIVSFLKTLLFRQTKRIVQYFSNAVRVYVLKGEEDARCAALAAAKIAGKKQRKTMVNLLSQMNSNVMLKYPDKSARDILSHRILSLINDMESKDWNPTDAHDEKDKLSKINAEYLSGLDQADPSIFIKKHPKLF